jgi:phycoerythrin-associated linker protein
MAFGPASRLGVSLFDETPPVEWFPGRSGEEAETMIRAVYRQVLGNAYVMESERLSVPESQFKRCELSVREFVRAVAKSDLYQSRFFTSCARYRAIELNFRHLLGRPPLDLEGSLAIHAASAINLPESGYSQISGSSIVLMDRYFRGASEVLTI